MSQHWSPGFNESFKFAILFNYVLALAVFYLPDIWGVNGFLGLSYSIISWSCGLNVWAAPVHAGAILASVVVNLITAVVFALYGRFSEEEIKLERKGGSVPAACVLTLIMMLFFCIFFLPCGGGAEESIQLSKVRIGAVLISYIRENYFLFSLALSVLSAGMFYALALTIKLFSLRK